MISLWKFVENKQEGKREVAIWSGLSRIKGKYTARLKTRHPSAFFAIFSAADSWTEATCKAILLSSAGKKKEKRAICIQNRTCDLWTLRKLNLPEYMTSRVFSIVDTIYNIARSLSVATRNVTYTKTRSTPGMRRMRFRIAETTRGEKVGSNLSQKKKKKKN